MAHGLLRHTGVVPSFDIAGRGRDISFVFHEIKNVRQEPGPGRRRWFESDNFDLVVWLEPGDRIAGFQLCYDFGRGEHALTWREGSGFAHAAVDSGESTPLKNCTPILVADGKVPWPEVQRRFTECCGSLEPGLRDFVQDKLQAKRPA